MSAPSRIRSAKARTFILLISALLAIPAVADGRTDQQEAQRQARIQARGQRAAAARATRDQARQQRQARADQLRLARDQRASAARQEQQVRRQERLVRVDQLRQVRVQRAASTQQVRQERRQERQVRADQLREVRVQRAASARDVRQERRQERQARVDQLREVRVQRATAAREVRQEQRQLRQVRADELRLVRHEQLALARAHRLELAKVRAESDAVADRGRTAGEGVRGRNRNASGHGDRSRHHGRRGHRGGGHLDVHLLLPSPVYVEHVYVPPPAVYVAPPQAVEYVPAVTLPPDIERGWRLLSAAEYDQAQLHFGDEALACPQRGAPRVGYALAAAATGDLKAGVKAMRTALFVEPQVLSSIRLDEPLVVLVSDLIARYEFACRDIVVEADGAFMAAGLHFLLGEYEAADDAIRAAIGAGCEDPTTRVLEELIRQTIADTSV